MRICRFLAILILGSALASGARDALAVTQAAAQMEHLLPQIPATVAAQFRLLAADALKEHYPDLAAKFVRAALDDVKWREAIDPELLSALTLAAPDETVALLRHQKLNSDQVVISALLQANRVLQAAALYRASIENGASRFEMPQVFKALGTQNPEEAKKLFADMLIGFSYQNASPKELLNLVNCAVAVAPFAPDLSAGVLEQVVKIASPADYRKALPGGNRSGSSDNSRNTLLVAAGRPLHDLSPSRFALYSDVISNRGLPHSLLINRINTPGPKTVPKREQTSESSISERIGKLRNISDADRPKTILELAQEILLLPRGSKLGLARNLDNLASEGDNGKEAIDSVAAALGAGIDESSPSARDYVELARLIRYEHAKAPLSDPCLEAADSLLLLRATVYQDNGLSLRSADGKSYSLDKLRGRVVLVNFWATWSQSCRKELPLIEALYQRFQKQGLVVLAVSSDTPDALAEYLGRTNYTFPVLLDREGDVKKAFGVEGVPKSFVFDPKGKLVALANNMRTENQLLNLLKAAGLQ